LGFKFNPITGFLDISSASSSGGNNFLPPVANEGSLPSIGTDGQLIVVQSTDHVYVFNASSNTWIDTGLTSGTVGNTPNSSGYIINPVVTGNVTHQQLVLEPADVSHPGILTASGQQHIGGIKTFDGAAVQVTNVLILPGVTPARALTVDGTGDVVSSITTQTELGYVSGVTSAIQTQLNNKINTSAEGVPNGVATLDGAGKVPVAQLPSTVMLYIGNWDPTTNIPALSDGTGTNGNVYYVTAARSTAVPGLTDPSMVNFQVGDIVIYSSAIGKWELTTPANGVQSVNGFQGVVSLTSDNIPQGSTNLYMTNGTQSFGGAKTFTGPSVTISNLLTLSSATANTALVTDGSKDIVSSVTTATEIGYVSGVTSSIQTQINNANTNSILNALVFG
jgi:hypothetical protein